MRQRVGFAASTSLLFSSLSLVGLPPAEEVI
jgi:hypothetical protein